MVTPKAQLYSMIEVLLDFASVEVDCLEATLDGWPEDAERARRGREAVEQAKEMLAKRTPYVRKQ